MEFSRPSLRAVNQAIVYSSIVTKKKELKPRIILNRIQIRVEVPVERGEVNVRIG